MAATVRRRATVVAGLAAVLGALLGAAPGAATDTTPPVATGAPATGGPPAAIAATAGTPAVPSYAIGDRGRGRRTRLVLVGAGTGTATALAAPPSFAATTSADGAVLAHLAGRPAAQRAGSPPRTRLVLRTAGGATVIARGRLDPPQLTSDGGQLTWGQGGRVLTRSAATGDIRLLWRASAGQRVTAVALAPDGSRLLLTLLMRSGEAVTRLVDTESGRTLGRQRHSAVPVPDPAAWSPDSRLALLRVPGSRVHLVVQRDGRFGRSGIPVSVRWPAWRADGVVGLRGRVVVGASGPDGPVRALDGAPPAIARLSRVVWLDARPPGDDSAPADPAGTAGGTGSGGTTPPVVTDPDALGVRLDIGDPVLTDIWVDPANGSDAATGADRAHALATVIEAWARIPASTPLERGFRINLVAGTYPEGVLPSYWEHRWGSLAAPVVITAADGDGTARLTTGINLFDSRSIYLIGVAVSASGEPFHCERCSDILLRRVVLDGLGTSQETLKANQSAGLHVEDSQLRGADQNALDFVAVQHATLVGNRIHDAGDWCAYVKGGSAYIDVVANEFHHCGTGGFTAGQGTGVEYLVAPWLRYEAYGIRVVNNVIHHTEGAGLGVNGGYNILLAHNTMYDVGRRSHALEFVHGSRSCDGDTAGCAERLAAGGWGVSAGDGGQWIPSRHVYAVNNVVHDPLPLGSTWSHLAVAGPTDPPTGSGVPSPARADDDLVIAGNVWWNGPADLDLGVGGDAGCRDDNPTCNAAQLRADNLVNVADPGLVDAAGGDLRPMPGGLVDRTAAIPIPPFDWSDSGVPAGAVTTTVTLDADGNPRRLPARPGAW